jgi:hypothetical protein
MSTVGFAFKSAFQISLCALRFFFFAPLREKAFHAKAQS